jgi:hypothetical protein
MKKQKGYIGAIGDDLPSLIPLFLGIVLFFAVFISTYNTYRSSTDVYSSQNEALRIANILKEEPIIIDYSFFEKICNKVDTKYKWTAFLVPIDLNYSRNSLVSISDLQNNGHENIILKENSYYFKCGDFEDFLDLQTQRGTSTVINYMFPLTVQKEVNVMPVKIYIAIWE